MLPVNAGGKTGAITNQEAKPGMSTTAISPNTVTPPNGGNGESSTQASDLSLPWSVAQSVKLTDGNGKTLNPAGSQGMAVDRLAHEISEAVDQFRAGKLSWRELAKLKEQAQQLWAQLPDSQAVTLRQAVARIDAQGRTPGDDTGWDVVEVLKTHRDGAAKGNISHGELRRAVAFARQVLRARQGNWVQGARENARQLIKDIDSKYLPALASLEVRQISAMEQTRRAFVQAPSQEGRQALQQWRDLLNARFNANEFAPTNGQALRQTLAAANKALGTPGPASAAPSPQAHRPRAGDIRETDVDPDGSGPKKGTFVGVVARGDIALQTRLVNLQAFDGQRWVPQGYGVRDLIQVKNGRVLQQTSASKDFLNVSLDEAKRQARAWLSQSPQFTGKPRPRVASQPVEIIETRGLAIKPGGVPLSGPTGARGFIQLLDQQVSPDARRYLIAGNALIGLRGNDLQNYVGVAMDLVPNVTPVRGGGNQLLYRGEALQAVGSVSDALRAAGGEAPQVRAVPVYLRVADDKMAKTTIFRVQGRDGRERIVDNVGRIYDSLEKWKQHNQLGAVDVFLPQGGQLQGRDGKVVLEAFNNRRFDNTALPVLRGGVAILGAAAGVAVMLGSGGVTAPLVMAGGAVFSVADSGATLADRAQHGQTLALSDRQARAAWLDFGAGLLGAGAIGSGSRVLARASDLADVLTLGNGARDLASDWNRLSPGERVLAGAQLAFWASMLGASQFHGGRFNMDSLMTRGGGSDGSAQGGDPKVKLSAPGGHNGASPPVDTRAQIQQQSQQVFQSGEFRQRFSERMTPAELDAIATNPTRLLQLAQDVALKTVVERSFSGSKVPPAVQQGFQSRAEAWAKQQARVNGGTAAGWLEALVMHPNGSGHRAELLRPVVAEHLGGGNKRLQNAVAEQLSPLGESALKNLVAPGPDGGPQKASVDLLRKALVARWAEDYKLSPQQQNRLNQAIGQRLEPKNRQDQMTDLRRLDSSGEIKNELVSQAQSHSAPGRGDPLVQANTRLSRKGLNTEGMSNAKPLTPKQIDQITSAAKAAGSYEKALVVLSDVAMVTGIPLKQLTGMKSVADVLKSFKTSAQPSPPSITSKADIPEVNAILGATPNFLNPGYPVSTKPWVDPSESGYKSTDPELIEAAFTKDKKLDFRLQPGPWFRKIYNDYITANPGYDSSKRRDASLEAYIKRTRTDLLASSNQPGPEPSSSVPKNVELTGNTTPSGEEIPVVPPATEASGTISMSPTSTRTNPSTGAGTPTAAAQQVDRLYQSYKNTPDTRLSWSQLDDLNRAVKEYLREIQDEIDKVNSIYADSKGFEENYKALLNDFSKVETIKQAEDIIHRAMMLKLGAKFAQQQGESRLNQVKTEQPRTLAEEEVYARYKTQQDNFNLLIDHLDLGSGKPIKAKIPGWKGDANGEVKIFEYDQKQNLLTVNAAAAMDVLTTGGEKASIVDQVFGYLSGTGNAAGVQPGLIARRVRLVLDQNAPAPLPGQDGLVRMPSGRKQDYRIRPIDREYAESLLAPGMTPDQKEVTVQKMVNYARRWYGLADTLLKRGVSPEEISFIYAQDGFAGILGDHGTRLANLMVGGYTSGIVPTMLDARLASPTDIIYMVLNNFKTRRKELNSDPKTKDEDTVPSAEMLLWPNIVEPKKLDYMVLVTNQTSGAQNLQISEMNYIINEKNRKRSRRSFELWILASGTGTILAAAAGITARNVLEINRELQHIAPDLNDRIYGNPKYHAEKVFGGRDFGIKLLMRTPPDKQLMVTGSTREEIKQAENNYDLAVEEWQASLPATQWNGQPLASKDAKGVSTPLSPEGHSKKVAEFIAAYGIEFVKNGLVEYFARRYNSISVKTQSLQVDLSSSDPMVVASAQKGVSDVRDELAVVNAEKYAAVEWLNQTSTMLSAESKEISQWFNSFNHEKWFSEPVSMKQPEVSRVAVSLQTAATGLESLSKPASDSVSTVSNTGATKSNTGEQIKVAEQNTTKSVDTQNENAATQQYPQVVSSRLTSEFHPALNRIDEGIQAATTQYNKALGNFNASSVMKNKATLDLATNDLEGALQRKLGLVGKVLEFLGKSGSDFYSQTGKVNTPIQNEFNEWKKLRDKVRDELKVLQSNASAANTQIYNRGIAAYNAYLVDLAAANKSIGERYKGKNSLVEGPNKVLMPPIFGLDGKPRSQEEIAEDMFKTFPRLFNPTEEAIAGAREAGVDLKLFRDSAAIVQEMRRLGQWSRPDPTVTVTETETETVTVTVTETETETLPKSTLPTPGSNSGE
jgi:hypothetical protein